LGYLISCASGVFKILIQIALIFHDSDISLKLQLIFSIATLVIYYKLEEDKRKKVSKPFDQVKDERDLNEKLDLLMND
jgi:hypothetical protein